MRQRTVAFGAAALAACILFASLIVSSRADDAAKPEISFALHKSIESGSEGPDAERTYFVAAGKRIALGVPKGCQLSGGDGLLLLLTDTGLDGEIHVKRSPFTPDLNLAENALQYRATAQKDLPEDAAVLQPSPPVMNPYPFNGWKSIGFTWSFSAFGRSQVRTVNYINLEMGVQIVVTTISAKSDAEKVDKIAKQFLASWWVMSDRR